MLWWTPAGRWSSPPTGRRPSSKASRSACARGSPAGWWSRSGRSKKSCGCVFCEARLAALKAEHPNFDVPAAVIIHVARQVTQNGRDLDGAVNRLLAHNQLSGRPVTIEMADDVIRDLVRPADPRRIRVEDILRIVSKHYGVSRADLLSARRTANVVRPRQIADVSGQDPDACARCRKSAAASAAATTPRSCMPCARSRDWCRATRCWPTRSRF